MCRRPRGARGEKTEAAGARTSALLLSLRKLASQCSLELTGLIGTTNTVSRFQMGQGCCLTERFQMANDDSRVLKPKNIISRVRLGRSTMACLSMAGMHAVARMSTRTACTRRPFETTRVSLLDAREASALAGFFSRRVKPHALRHTEQSIWMDQTRRHGRALGDTRTPRRWAMAPSNESIPSEGEAARKALFPQVRASLVLACLRFLLPTAKAASLTKLFSLLAMQT